MTIYIKERERERERERDRERQREQNIRENYRCILIVQENGHINLLCYGTLRPLTFIVYR